MQEIIVGRKYRHYKGNIYTVIALAKHSETLEDMVVYQGEKGDIWVRPKSMWNDKIGVAGLTPHPHPLSPKGRGENDSEADLSSHQDKLVDTELSADHLSTCVALRFTLI